MHGTAIYQATVVTSYLLVIIALWISATRTLKLMVRLYQAQALVLTCVVLLTAVQHYPSTKVALWLVAILPLALAAVAPTLLARATIDAANSPQAGGNGRITWLDRLRDYRRRILGEAELIWLQHGGSRLPVSLSAAIDMGLIATAVLVAFRLVGPHSQHRVLAMSSLAVAFALLLQGLFTMINKNDIISQIIGLLVVDQGLFLAAVRIAPPSLAYLFVLGLFLYMLVTLTILLWVLPGLHRTSASIEVLGNAELRG